MYIDQKVFINTKRYLLKIWIEPWAFGVEVPSGSVCKVYGESDEAGQFFIERKGNDLLIIYGWGNS